METALLYLGGGLAFAGWLVWLAHRAEREEEGLPVQHPLRDQMERWRHRHRGPGAPAPGR